MTNHIGITGDIHMGRGGEQGIKRTERVLNEIIDGWIQADIKIGIIAGDLFDKYINFGEYTYDVVSSILERAIKAGIDIHAIKGSHDIKSDGIRSAVNPLRHIGVNVYDVITDVATIDWQLTFVPWITKVAMKSNINSTTVNAQGVVLSLYESVMAELKVMPTTDRTRLLITHASFVGFSPCSTAASIIGTDFVLDPIEIQKLGYKTIVAGHFHKRDIKKTPEGLIIYPGAPERLNFGEADNPCGWLEISPEGENIWHELSQPRIFRTIEKDTPCPYDGIQGGVIKLRPEFSHAEVIDYEALKAPYYKAGAESVEVDVQWTDEIATRSREIKADQTEGEQLRHYATENPDKVDLQDMGLYEFERVNGFRDVVDEKFIEEAVKNIGA